MAKYSPQQWASFIQSRYGLNTGIAALTDTLFDARLREACTVNACGAYGTNWMCPPHVGDIDKLIAKAKQYQEILTFQMICPLEDSYDFDGMMNGQKAFQNVFFQIAEEVCAQIPDAVILGAGGCTLCEECGAKTDTPCRYPEKARPSLESYGFQVSVLAKHCAMNYINGVNTVTYFGAILF